jgi:uncharacterized protein with FMN-binding domain
MKKARKKMVGWIITICIVSTLGIAGAVGWSKLDKEHKEAASLPLNRVDFTRLKDGTYTGRYEGGMYKWRENETEVTVTGGKVTDIKLIQGVEKRKGDSMELLYDRVIKEQSLQVDTISSATLQGVENALVQAN